MYHSYTDEYLFDLAGNNDNDALTTLMKRYQHLSKLIRRELIDKANVNDVMQIAWLQALASKHTFDVKVGPFDNWFFTIACRAALKNNRTVQRDRKHVKLLPAYIAAERIEKPEYAPEAVAMATERAERVTEARSALSEDDQDIVQQFYFQEKTVTEIADDNRIEVEKVKSRLRQARKLIKPHLKGVK